jgi:hypothetical protein
MTRIATFSPSPVPTALGISIIAAEEVLLVTLQFYSRADRGGHRMLHVFRLPMVLRRSKAFRRRNVKTNLCSKSVYRPPTLNHPATLRFRTSLSSKLNAAFAGGPVPPIPPSGSLTARMVSGRDKFKRVDFRDCRAPLPTHAWTKDRKLDQSRLLWHPNNPHP